jgi:hypothetical protein
MSSSHVLSRDEAIAKVVRRDRHCQRWCNYEEGLDPRQHHVELSSRALEEDRRAFYIKVSELEQRQSDSGRRRDRRLTVVALTLGLTIGLFQIIAAVIAMTPDSFGAPLVRWILRGVHHG